MSAVHKSKTMVQLQTLRSFCVAALAAACLAPEQAERVADAMTEADLTGSDGHGVARLQQYVGALKKGDVNRNANVRIDRTGSATALVDGDNGMGHWVMTLASNEAVKLASETGIGWVGVRKSNHAGAAGIYAAIPAAHGMVGIYSAVSGVNHMAPSGGAEPLLGTNPLAIAIPAREGAPLLLDIAMSVVSWGKIRSHALQKTPMPEGYMVDRATGKPLVDADTASQGVMLPVGDYKGAGLALMFGLLAGTLNGAAFGRQLPDFSQPSSGCGVNTGQFIVALDVSRFMPLHMFRLEVARQIESFETSTALPNASGVRLPGVERHRRRTDRLANGIPLSAELLQQLDGLAVNLGISQLITH